MTCSKRELPIDEAGGVVRELEAAIVELAVLSHDTECLTLRGDSIERAMSGAVEALLLARITFERLQGSKREDGEELTQ
jgi:hypothetical protein